MKRIEYSAEIESFINSYDRKNYKIWNTETGMMVKVRASIREHYLKEQTYCCAYCRIEKKESHGMTWDVEHILPKSKFPQYLFEPENLAIACKECNGAKDDFNILADRPYHSSKFPSKSLDYTIVHPHFDIYENHFEVVEIQRKRIYRLLNGEKAKQTYIACNLSRFDYKFCEWESYNEALVRIFSDFLDKCPPDANPEEVKRMLGHLDISKKTF